LVRDPKRRSTTGLNDAIEEGSCTAKKQTRETTNMVRVTLKSGQNEETKSVRTATLREEEVAEAHSAFNLKPGGDGARKKKKKKHKKKIRHSKKRR